MSSRGLSGLEREGLWRGAPQGRHHLQPMPSTPGCGNPHGGSDLKEQLPFCQPVSAAGRKQGRQVQPPSPLHRGASQPPHRVLPGRSAPSQGCSGRDFRTPGLSLLAILGDFTFNYPTNLLTINKSLSSCFPHKEETPPGSGSQDLCFHLSSATRSVTMASGLAS